MRLFLENLINISLMAGVFTLAVLVIRQVFKRAPKALIMCMWALVALRLLCPYTIRTDFGVMPRKVIEQRSEITGEQPRITYIVMGKPAVTKIRPAKEKIDPYKVAGIVWIAGSAVMLTAGAVSYIRLQRRIRAKIRIEDNIYICDDVDTPFVVGMMRPKIIIPSNMDKKALDHVLNHERMHIRHKDNIWKPLGYILLSLNWFNPVIWIAYISFCKDMELYCDESVIKGYSKERAAQYLEALLNLSTSRNPVMALAFGEIGIGYRIRSITKYKKPAIALIVVCVITMAVATACFLTNKDTDPTVSSASADAVEQTATSELTEDELAEYLIKDDDFVTAAASSAMENLAVTCPSKIGIWIDSVKKNDDGGATVTVLIQNSSEFYTVSYKTDLTIDGSLNITGASEYEFYGSQIDKEGGRNVYFYYPEEGEIPQTDSSDDILLSVSSMNIEPDSEDFLQLLAQGAPNILEIDKTTVAYLKAVPAGNETNYLLLFEGDKGLVSMTVHLGYEPVYLQNVEAADTEDGNSNTPFLVNSGISDDNISQPGFVSFINITGDSDDTAIVSELKESGEMTDPYDPNQYDYLVIFSYGNTDLETELIQKAEEEYKTFDDVLILPIQD